MRRTRIKICGLTRSEDVAVAVEAGADALGVIFAPSPRQLAVEEAAAVFAAAPPGVSRIGVFVDPDIALVAAAIDRCALSAVQLHGHESPEFCDAIPVPVVKALRVGEDFTWAEAERYRGHVAALLLDTLVAGMAGGTSRQFRWQGVGELPDWAPAFVAGGLDPSNVEECIATMRPFAVDTSSGVELSPGIKDAEKIRAFCEAVERIDRKGWMTR